MSSGVAQTNERVSELLRNTAYKSEWLERPELIEIKAGQSQTANREQRRLFDFSMRVTLKRPQECRVARTAAAPAPSRGQRAQAVVRQRRLNMAKSLNVDIDSSYSEQAASQFRGLNSKEPGQWPILPKTRGLAVLLALAVVVLGWFLVLSTAADDLEAERNKEPALKQDYRGKLAQAVNLAELRKQKLQVRGVRDPA